MKPDAPAQESSSPTGSAITFSKDIPLKRDAMDAPHADPSVSIQAFFLLVVAIAALVLYWFGRRRRAHVRSTAQTSTPFKAFGFKLSRLAASNGPGEPTVMHFRRLDRQQSLCVIEWHGVQHLVALSPSNLSVIASQPAIQVEGQEPTRSAS
jgi:hypothetical protein